MAVDFVQAEGVSNDTDDGSLADSAIAAAAAEAIRNAAQPLDPTARAIEGFRLAAGSVSAGAKAQDTAIADAAANARTILNRTDLPPDQAATIKNSIERLGNAIIDGKVDPHVNNQFRDDLYRLATEPVGSSDYKKAAGQLTAAARTLQEVQLAPGTKLQYDPRAGAPSDPKTGFPRLDVPKLDADLHFKTQDGTLHVTSAKYGVDTLADTVKEQRDGKSQQLAKQGEWESRSSPAEPRKVSFYTLDKSTGFLDLMNDKNIKVLENTIQNPGERNIILGNRAYSLNELKALDADIAPKAQASVEAKKTAYVAAGNDESTFNVRDAYSEYYRQAMATPEAAMQTAGKTYGQPTAELKALKGPQLPTMKQGALWGGVAAGGISLIRAAAGGKLTVEELKSAGGSTALGAGLGALTAKGEQFAIPMVDRAIGQAVQQRATSAASSLLSQEAAQGAGFAARTLATRVVGSTAVGAVVTAGVSAFENRDGLMKGDSHAIGNVAADTTVGIASVAAATATGAAIGSVVPIAGTAVGAVAGLVVGVGIAYGAQISGARDAIANTVSGWVDGVKGWFR